MLNMHYYKNILIAVDGSQEAEWAFNKAVDIAHRNNAKLTIANIVDSRTFSSYEGYAAKFTDKTEGSFGEDLLNGYKKIAQDAGLKNVETRLDNGSPKTYIPKVLAKEINADLIISGSSGLNAVERMIVGSVSEAIVRYAPCDTLVIRSEQIPEGFEPTVATKELHDKYNK